MRVYRQQSHREEWESFATAAAAILADVNWQKALLYSRERNRITFTTALVHSQKMNRTESLQQFSDLTVKRQQFVPVLAEKKVPLFKCAILSCYSWNRWVIKLNWARSPTLQTAGSLWYGGGRLSQNNLLMGRFASLQQSFFGWWCVSQRLFAAYAATDILNNEFKMHFISSLSSFFFEYTVAIG